jgi:hypothetical protein
MTAKASAVSITSIASSANTNIPSFSCPFECPAVAKASTTGVFGKALEAGLRREKRMRTSCPGRMGTLGASFNSITPPV